MKVYENGIYTVINYTCANRRNIAIVTGYEVLSGIPIWKDTESTICLSHYGNRKTTQTEIDLAIEISKIYIEKLLLTNENQ